MALKYSEAVAITSFIKLQNKSALFIPTLIYYYILINLFNFSQIPFFVLEKFDGAQL